MMVKLRCGAVLLGLTWCAVFVGCLRDSGNARADGPRHLILIVVDTLRADVLGCYGGPVSTPNIDSLAAEGVRFSQAFSHIPITGPSHSSIFTSLLPHEHGVRNNGQVLAQEHRTMAEILQAEGWYTAAFISLGVLGKRWGYDQGFAEYYQLLQGDPWLTAGLVNQQVLPWLDKLDHDKVFMWVHYSDPHAPYLPPGVEVVSVRVRLNDQVIATVKADGRNHRLPVILPQGSSHLVLEAEDSRLRRTLKVGRLSLKNQAVSLRNVTGLKQVEQRAGLIGSWTKLPVTAELDSSAAAACETYLELSFTEGMNRQTMVSRYNQEVTYVDTAIGELVRALKAKKLWQESVIVFTSDHGEGLGDHKLSGHVHQLYNSLLHVPLIIVAPGQLTPGVVEEAPVSLVDILPTTLDLLDVELPEGVRGKSISLSRVDREAVRAVVAETYRPQSEDDRLAIVSDGFKYIFTVESGKEELYDLEHDPGELDNLAAEQPALVSRLRDLLEQQGSGMPATVLGPELTDEELSMLSALGYAGQDVATAEREPTKAVAGSS
jgi:arylsulfatase A-like enzyme